MLCNSACAHLFPLSSTPSPINHCYAPTLLFVLFSLKKPFQQQLRIENIEILSLEAEGKSDYGMRLGSRGRTQYRKKNRSKSPLSSYHKLRCVPRINNNGLIKKCRAKVYIYAGKTFQKMKITTIRTNYVPSKWHVPTADSLMLTYSHIPV